MNREVLIYLVDRDEERCNAVLELLQAQTPNVRTFSSTKQFLKERDSEPVGSAHRGCVIIGVDSPDDGGTVSATLLDREDDLPVVLLASKVNISGVVQSIRSGAFDCLVNPIRPAQLRQCVQAAIDEHERRVNARQKVEQLRDLMEHMTADQRHLVGWACSNVLSNDSSHMRFAGVKSQPKSPGRNGSRNGSGNGHTPRRRRKTEADILATFPAVTDELDSLPRRMRQTLVYILQGDGEKQIAHRMGLSKHTIHDYVKLLHKRFGVSSRGELMAKCLGSKVDGGSEVTVDDEQFSSVS